MRYIFCSVNLFILSLLSCWGQSSAPVYRTDWVKDGSITIAGTGMAVAGSMLILKKDRLTEADLFTLDKNKVNRFDRFSAGYYSSSAKKLSDIPFYTSFGLPLLFLADSKALPQAPQIYLLYAQAMSITGGLFALTAGLTNRTRPNVYGANTPLEERLHKYGTNSFFGGHTAATASATFFTAKVFHDLHPDSGWRPVVWGGAVVVPAAVGYLRLKAGKHFLSDNLLGYAIGAGTGILVPELHKASNRLGLKVTPGAQLIAGEAIQGIAFEKVF